MTKPVSSKENGATLVVALIMLLIMSIVGVASLQSVTLQERMASNSRQLTLARNNAEFALRTAEDVLKALKKVTDLSVFFDATQKGFFSAIPLSGKGRKAPKPLSFDETTSETWFDGGQPKGVEVAGLDAKIKAKDPQYIIEYIGRGATDGAAQVDTLGPRSSENKDPFYFRVVAIGWGADEKVYSILESTFRTGDGPGVFVY